MFLSMSMTNGTAGQKAIAMVICFILLINVKLWIIISSIFIQLVLTCVNCRGSTSLAYTKAQPDVFKHEHDKWHCWAKGDSHGHLLYFIDKC